jgi:sugar phosphate isomerase/epimerase
MLVENLDAVLGVGLQPEIYFNGFTLDRLSPAEVERTSEALHGKGVPVTFHAPFMDLNPGAVDERVREITAFRFEQVLKLVPHFQPRSIVFHPGYDRWRYDDDVDLWRENSLLTWKPLLKKAETLGVKMALENVFDHNPEPLRKILEEINSPFLGTAWMRAMGTSFPKSPWRTGSRFWDRGFGKFTSTTTTEKATTTFLWARGASTFPPSFPA